MKIALIGYGKMGKTIEKLAIDKGHEIVFKSDKTNIDAIKNGKFNHADVAIEFTEPNSAVDNILACFEHKIPVVSGTTGWLKNKWDHVIEECKNSEASFFYASNFSIGVNIFFEINERLAQLMNDQNIYQAEIEEIHHIHKHDAPSGTALSIASGIINHSDRYEDWYMKNYEQENVAASELPIISKREGEVPGTHIVRYKSAIDDLEISHIAKGREGFASGALMAAEWLIGKKGVYGMKDLLKL